MFGFYRVGTASIYSSLADPTQNLKKILKVVREARERDLSIVVFPELSLTGYTVGDLFYQQNLYQAQNRALEELIEETKDSSIVIVVGIFLKHLDRLYNCAVVLQSGEILGVIPKSYIPNRVEFYEKRYFSSGIDIKAQEITFLSQRVPFGVDILFSDGDGLTFGVEICEDLWAVTPPSLAMCESGATMILNLSSSNELVGKSDYRKSLVSSQSARGVCAYLYSSSGVGESSTDTIFGGECLIGEYGSIIAEGERFLLDNQLVVADVDIFRLKALREREGSFCDARVGEFRVINLKRLPTIKEIDRFIDPHPFVPNDRDKLNSRAKEIIQIQAHSLIRRLIGANIKRVIIGVSGGLDSTLALLVIHYAFGIIKKSSKDIIALLMPGLGTTSRTFNNSIALCESLEVDFKVISIKELALKEFELIGHSINIQDVTYENVQARARTSILMNLSNKEGAIVIGTGDLSEIALGWSTYNGDHMSMYGINSSIPKSLIRYLIEFFAINDSSSREILEDILETPVSPELLPADNDKISQKTEDIIGPYELHDFFLYHFIRYGSSVERIFYLATLAFADKYNKATIKKWLKLFLKRFFTQQFKRSCMPDGVKVGTISLSPRADWRMPSDARVSEWIEAIERIEI